MLYMWEGVAFWCAIQEGRLTVIIIGWFAKMKRTTYCGYVSSTAAVPNLFGTRNQCSYENLIPDDLIPDLILWIPNAWGGAKAVMLVLGNSCQYRWSFASSPTAHLLLGPVLVWAQGSGSPALLKSQLILIFSYTFNCLGMWLAWSWSHSVWDLQWPKLPLHAVIPFIPFLTDGLAQLAHLFGQEET